WTGCANTVISSEVRHSAHLEEHHDTAIVIPAAVPIAPHAAGTERCLPGRLPGQRPPARAGSTPAPECGGRGAQAQVPRARGRAVAGRFVVSCSWTEHL